MEIQSCILERRTIHNYKEEPVSEELIQKAIELALCAPNHKHTHPWHFFVFDKTARQKIAERGLAKKVSACDGNMSEVKQQALLKKYLNPSHLILLGQKICSDSFQSREDYASVACGVQNMSLFLWSHGIGTKWSSGGLTKDPLVYDLASWNRDEIESVGFLWAGVPEIVPTMPVRPSWQDRVNSFC